MTSHSPTVHAGQFFCSVCVSSGWNLQEVFSTHVSGIRAGMPETTCQACLFPWPLRMTSLGFLTPWWSQSNWTWWRISKRKEAESASPLKG